MQSEEEVLAIPAHQNKSDTNNNNIGGVHGEVRLVNIVVYDRVNLTIARNYGMAWHSAV
jgi:hypothetical protein